jgi:hypothetical protein
MRKQRRQILLLEVMIALAIIVLCIFPLIYPHAALARSQRTFLHKIDLDHVITLIFSDIYQDLQKNQYEWADIQSQRHFDIDPDRLKKYNGNKALPYKGYYYFEEEIHKPKSTTDQQTFAYIYKVRFVFHPIPEKKIPNPKDELKYDYKVFILRELRQESAQNKEVQPDEKPSN